MKFSIRLIEYVGKARELVRLAVEAEAAGFDGIWFPHDPFMRSTWPLTVAVAENTSRIEIGSVGTNPYTTHPSEIATYLATLDELSQGRAVLGLGLHSTLMVDWTGQHTRDYLQRTREATEMIRALFRGEVVERHTDCFDWSDQCYLRFKPYRDAVPILICPFGDDYLRLSGEIGDGSLPMITPPESAAVMVPPIRQGAIDAGRDPDALDIAGCGWLSLSADGKGTGDLLRPMAAYFGPYLEEGALNSAGLSRADFDNVKGHIEAADYAAAHAAVTPDMFKLGITGRPRDVIARIEALAANGVNHVSLGGPLGPDPREAIRLMGEKVLPHFR